MFFFKIIARNGLLLDYSMYICITITKLIRTIMKANLARIVAEVEPELKQALVDLAERRGQTMKGALRIMIQREIANDMAIMEGVK